MSKSTYSSPPTSDQLDYLDDLFQQSETYDTPEEVIQEVLEREADRNGFCLVNKWEASQLIKHLKQVGSHEGLRRKIRYKASASNLGKPSAVIKKVIGERKEVAELTIQEANEVIEYLDEA